MRIPLDHIGILCGDLDATITSWRALGFEVTDPVDLDPGTGDAQGRQRSAHIAFQDHYLELSCVTDATPDHPLYRWTLEPDAARILVFACENAEAKQAELKAQGFNVSPVREATRTSRHGEARFRWFALDEDSVPGTLTAWVQHLTPDRVFAPAGHRHPNGIAGFRALLCRHTGALEPFVDDRDNAVQCLTANTPEEGTAAVVGATLFGTVPDDFRQRLLNEKLATTTGVDTLQVEAASTGGLKLTLESRR